MQYALSDLLCSFEFRFYIVKSKFTDAFEKQLPRNIDPQLRHKVDASGAQQTDAIGDMQAQVACQADRWGRGPCRESRRTQPEREAPAARRNQQRRERDVNIVRIVLQVLLVLSSFFLIMSILLHKGKGGGLSDMFGGGISSSAGSSGVAERNLDRITVAVAVIWTITIVGLGLVAKLG